MTDERTEAPPTLELVMEGPAGTISVASFVKMLDNTIAIAQGVDSVITHTKTGLIEWYVEDLRMGSLQATLVARPKRGRALTFQPRVVESVAEAVVSGLRSVEYAPTVPPEFPEPSMRRARQLGNLIGKAGGPRALRATVTDLHPILPARVTSQLGKNAKEALTPRQETRGSIMGTLEIVSVHRGQVVTLYDEINRRATRGSFDRNTQFELVKSALGKRVLVDGILRRNGLGEIVSILMDSIEILPDEANLPSVRDLLGSEPDLTGGLTAVEYQRLRREA